MFTFLFASDGLNRRNKPENIFTSKKAVLQKFNHHKPMVVQRSLPANLPAKVQLIWTPEMPNKLNRAWFCLKWCHSSSFEVYQGLNAKSLRMKNSHAITCCQIPVYKLLLCQIFHSFSNLEPKANQILNCWILGKDNKTIYDSLPEFLQRSWTVKSIHKYNPIV